MHPVLTAPLGQRKARRPITVHSARPANAVDAGQINHAGVETPLDAPLSRRRRARAKRRTTTAALAAGLVTVALPLAAATGADAAQTSTDGEDRASRPAEGICWSPIVGYHVCPILVLTGAPPAGPDSVGFFQMRNSPSDLGTARLIAVSRPDDLMDDDFPAE